MTASAARLARAALRRRADARDRSLGDRAARRAVAGPHGARRRGPGAADRPARRRAARSRSSAARATTAATGSSPGACCASCAARCGSCCSPNPPSTRATRRRTCAGSTARTSRSRPRRSASAAVVVDAIFGTGFAGEPRGAAADAIAAMAALGVPIVSADIASGVDASTGEAARVSVVASATVTFAAAKPGHWIAPGKQHTGATTVVDIGIPPGGPATPDVGWLTPRVHALVPGRGAPATKFSSGHVVVAGGSRGLTGAPCLAAEAAMRAGAGYVSALVPASLELVFETRLLEVMTRGLADEDGAHAPARRRGGAGGDRPRRRARARPGQRAQRRARSPSCASSRRAPACPLVLDADGLNAHAGALEALADRAAPTVLTPHAGELARLLGITSDEVGARRLRSAREAARRAQRRRGPQGRRHDRGAARRRRRGQRPERAGPGDGRHGRRAERRDRRLSRQGPGSVRRRLRRGAPPRRRRTGGRRRRTDPTA